MNAHVNPKPSARRLAIFNRISLLSAATIGVAFAWSSPVLAACVLDPVTLKPVPGSDFRDYAGQQGTIRIALTNAIVGKPADVFPEPPLVISTDGASCSIASGIWISDGFFLSREETVLWAYEFSGSSAEMVAYDVRSCREVGRVDADGLRPQFSMGTLAMIGADCQGSCSILSQPPLTDSCLPIDK